MYGPCDCFFHHRSAFSQSLGVGRVAQFETTVETLISTRRQLWSDLLFPSVIHPVSSICCKFTIRFSRGNAFFQYNCSGGFGPLTSFARRNTTRFNIQIIFTSFSRTVNSVPHFERGFSRDRRCRSKRPWSAVGWWRKYQHNLHHRAPFHHHRRPTPSTDDASVTLSPSWHHFHQRHHHDNHRHHHQHKKKKS